MYNEANAAEWILWLTKKPRLQGPVPIACDQSHSLTILNAEHRGFISEEVLEVIDLLITET
jgi:hypothetical protein